MKDESKAKSMNVIEQQILSLTNGGLDIYEYFMEIKYHKLPTHERTIPNMEYDSIGLSGHDNFYTYKMYREQDGKMELYWEFENAIEWLHLNYLWSKGDIYRHLNEVFNLGLNLIFSVN